MHISPNYYNNYQTSFGNAKEQGKNKLKQVASKTILPLSIALSTAGGTLVTKNHIITPEAQGYEIVITPEEKMVEGSLLGLGILGLGASAVAKRKEDEETSEIPEKPKSDDLEDETETSSVNETSEITDEPAIEENSMTEAQEFAENFHEQCMELIPSFIYLKGEEFKTEPYKKLLDLINNPYGVCYDETAKEKLGKELNTLINYEGCEGAQIKANDKVNDIVYLMEKVSSSPEKWELRRQKYPQYENDPNMPLDVYNSYVENLKKLDNQLGGKLEYYGTSINNESRKIARNLFIEIATHGISSKSARNEYFDMLQNVWNKTPNDQSFAQKVLKQWKETKVESFTKYNSSVDYDIENSDSEVDDSNQYFFDADGIETGGIDKNGHTFVTENLKDDWKVRKTTDGVQHYVKDNKELYTYKFDNSTQLPKYKYNIEQGEIERHDGVKVYVTGNTKDREIENIEIYPNGVRVENYAGFCTSETLRSVQLNPDGSRVENYGQLNKSYKIFNQSGVHVGGLDCRYGKYVVDEKGQRIYEKDDDSDNSGSSSSSSSSSTSTPSIISTPSPQDNDAMAIAAQMLGIDVKDLQGVNGVNGTNGLNEIIRPKTNKAKQKKNTTTKLTFADIGGQDEAIEKMKKTILYPIKYPDIYKNQKISHGVILYGPPGTGKSLIAEALANETDASFIKLNGLELESKFVGESEKQWRELFDKARKQQPCIIFLDEFEAVCGKRGRNSSNDSSDKVVNQILTLLSDIEKNGDNIFLVCATNRLDMIDDAIARSGRLETHIEITAPKTTDDIKKIFDIHTKNIALADDIDKDKISENLLKHKATGADIASIVALAKEKSFERKDEYGLNIYDRMENGLLTKDAVEKLKVTNQDFDDAIKEKYNKSGEGSAPRKIGFGQ